MDEWEQLRERLAAAGVAGVEDLGRFVSNPKVLGESRFDERAAMPVLIDALPTLSDSHLVSAVVGHLRRPWARPAAFDALVLVFEKWAQRDALTGWHLGDALGATATQAHAETLLMLAQDSTYGEARQMVAYALGRFKTAPGVERALLGLVDDSDVALHAMQALKRVLGPERVLAHLERLEREHAGTRARGHANRRAGRPRSEKDPRGPVVVFTTPPPPLPRSRLDRAAADECVRAE